MIVLALIILVFSIATFVLYLITGISSITSSIDNRVIVPGERAFYLKESGTYTVFYENRSVLNGVVIVSNAIDGLVCSLQNDDTGETIALKNATVSSHYSFGNREGSALFEFDIKTPGYYKLSGLYPSGDGEKAVLAISKGFFSAILRLVFLGIGILFIGCGLSLAAFLYALHRRRKASGEEPFSIHKKIRE